MRRCLILLHAVAAAAKSCDESRLVSRPDYAERLLRAAIQCNASRIESAAAVANLAVAGTGSQTLADALQAWRGVVGKRARPAGVPRLPRRRLLLGEAARRGGDNAALDAQCAKAGRYVDLVRGGGEIVTL